MPTLNQIKAMSPENYKVTDFKLVKGKPLKWDDSIHIFIEGENHVKTVTRKSAHAAGLCYPATEN